MNQHTLTVFGHATADVETLETKAGKEFSKFGVAINEYRGSDEEAPVFFYNVACFSKHSKLAAQNISKGDLVFVQGKPDPQAYISKDGEPKLNLGIIASHVKVYKTPEQEK